MPPVIGIAGHSGAGKTTLLERLVVALRARGLRVGAVKHASKGFAMDRAGKDTDRFFQAGADPVLAIGPLEAVLRLHAPPPIDEAPRFLREADLVLVEGFKAASWPRIWVGEDAPPFDDPLLVVGPGGPSRDDVETVALRVLEVAAGAHASREIVAAVLIGGQSKRMGAPKHLLLRGGTTWVERVVAAAGGLASTVVAAGAGTLPPALSGLPRLPDAPGTAGPLAGLLSAQRCFPDAAILLLSCDCPDVLPSDLGPLLAARSLGTDAVSFRFGGALQPIPAVFEPTGAVLTERRAWAGASRASLHGLLDDLRAVAIDAEGEGAARLRGYNTRADSTLG